MYQRVVNISQLLEKKSHFLIGPRQTGKSTLWRRALPEAFAIDLLEAQMFRRLSAHPEDLGTLVAEVPIAKPIVIDEIQKAPSLLDEVQRILDAQPMRRFLLTGSSARKLRRQGVNLLGGRAWTQRFHPLVTPECAEISLSRRLAHGSLPSVLNSAHPKEELLAYVGSYLKEEIHAEGLTRSLGAFARFLEVAGMCAGEQVNYASIGNDAQIPARTVKDHFQILEDTLVASLLAPFELAQKRKAVSTPKFYFFDVGVTNALRGNVDEPASPDVLGRRLEHLIHDELSAYISYCAPLSKLTYWRTRTALEVDFVLDTRLAVEVKAKTGVRDGDLKPLLALGEEFPKMPLVLACLEPLPRRVGRVRILPAAAFLKELWSGEVFEE
jgi:predicted AAA+ superfamily ATPase